MRKSNKKTNKRFRRYFLFKYWPFIILFCSAVISLIFYMSKVDIDEPKNTMLTDIIIPLMSLIFTIITLSLSLSSETIYGMPFNLIRKIRKDKHFELKEMIYLNILIVVLLTVFGILGFTIQVWSMGIISIIYCVMFCSQEIPLLSKDNSYVKKIIRDSGYLGEISKYNDYYDGATSDGKITLDIIQSIVLSDGIVSAYNSFKTSDESKNIIILDNLLSLQNNF